MTLKHLSSVAALALLIGAGHAVAQDADADARFERLKVERAAEVARQREAQERYEQGVRDAAAARARYEADMTRHNEEVQRAQAAQADYERQRANHLAETGGQAGSGSARPERTERRGESRRESRQARSVNEQCRRRARGRGRLLGGLVGGIAGGIVGRNAAEMVAISAPISLLMGEAITRLLDCREQEQAAAATEQVVQQAQAQAQTAGAERGVGQTVAWTSETRPGVTGSSTVTALEQEAGGGECMTVTDIIIVDGQETRAPKRLCRRPPSQRFLRV
jgi:hypothetical protein